MEKAPNGSQLKIYRAELHVHTVLSPCAAVEMIPPLIISEAETKGIQILAVTDHNAIANVEAVMQAAEGTNITVLAGMELHTREEVHILCIFPGLSEAADFNRLVESRLPRGVNRREVWGPQYVVDATGQLIREEEKILSMAIGMNIDEAAAAVHRLKGLFIPAHIQRSMYGILPTLGFLPPEIPFDAVELPVRQFGRGAAETSLRTCPCPVVYNGDAHYLEDIQGQNRLLLLEPSFDEIRLALRRQQGRSLVPQ